MEPLTRSSPLRAWRRTHPSPKSSALTTKPGSCRPAGADRKSRHLDEKPEKNQTNESSQISSTDKSLLSAKKKKSDHKINRFENDDISYNEINKIVKFNPQIDLKNLLKHYHIIPN
jgi:hypothetical protein